MTARGGSQGVPRKNVRPLEGRPLIYYTAAAVGQASLLTRCILSTDSEEIAEVGRQVGLEVPFSRPAALATADALALAVLHHAIDWMREHEGETYDYVMMLQPTSPLRIGADIDACIRVAAETNADSVFSMRKIADFAPQKLKRIINGEIHPLLEPEQGESAPRQKGPDVYKRNGAIYMTRTSLVARGDQFGARSMAYVMPAERSVDINDESDFDRAAFWMTRLGIHA